MLAIFFTAAAALSPTPTSEVAADNRPVVEWSYQSELLPDNLLLKLHNRGRDAICLPRAEVQGASLLLLQNGHEVVPIYHNEAILYWRGMNMISGFIVIPPGTSISLFYNLQDWSLAPGQTEARIELRSVGCFTFFGATAPSIAHDVATYQFVANPTQAIR